MSILEKKRSKKRQVNLHFLYERNLNTINRLFGREFVSKSKNGGLSRAETISANEVLADFLYTKKIADYLRLKDNSSLEIILGEKIKGFFDKKENLIDRVCREDIGLLVIRPEIIHMEDDILNFILKKDYRVIFSKSISISFDQYWVLYDHGLRHPDSWYDFPTRTLNYVGLGLIIIVFGRKNGVEKKYSVIDEFMKEYKGERGVFKQETLRGEVVYNEFLEMGVDMPLSGRAAIAFDPIQAYRNIVSGKIESDELHKQADNELLFYAGAGIHSPDSKEMKKDLAALLGVKDLELLLSKLR